MHRRFVAALIKVGDLSRHSETDGEFYQRLLEVAVDIVPAAQAGSMQLAIDGGSKFRFIAAVGFDLEKLKLTTLDKAYLFRDIETPKAQVVHSIGQKAKSLDGQYWMDAVGRADEIKSTLSTPVIVDGKTVAFWALDNFDNADAFDDTALETMTVMAQFLGGLLARRQLESQLLEEQETLRRLATCDPLTGLANRREFVARLDSSLMAASSKLRASAVLFVDLDDLKQLNDSLGHDYGDRVLRTVGQRIQSTLRSGDLVARWGGDEFLVLPARVDSPDEAMAAAERIIASVTPPMPLGDGRTQQVSLSIGVGWTFDSDVSAESLINAADAALYTAKDEAKGSIRMHKI